MSEIFIDHDCKVCSSYGQWINTKEPKMKINDQKKLSTYHNHLKSLGFHPSYSPTAGTTWKLKK